MKLYTVHKVKWDELTKKNPIDVLQDSREQPNLNQETD